MMLDIGTGACRRPVRVTCVTSDPIERQVLGVVADLIASRPDLKLGAYLHGSQLHGTVRPDSDIDVLVVADWTTPRSETKELQETTLAAHTTEPIGAVLDLKILPAATIADDPWVDVHRARFLGGHPWHEELPPRSHDQAARESLLVLQGIYARNDLDQLQPRHLRKPVGRLASVVAAILDSDVPQSRTEARHILLRHTDSGLTQTLVKIIDELGDLDPDESISDRLHAEIADASAATAELLQLQLDADGFGPRCTQAAQDALDAYKPKSPRR